MDDRWMRRRALLAAALASAGLLACGGGSDDDDDDETPEAQRADDPMPKADAQMQAVLDELALLGAQPVHTLSVAQARAQPGAADAVRSLLARQGRASAPEPVAGVVERTIPGPAGALPARLYTPSGVGPFPVLLYLHGGGWVLGTLDSHDASARALCNAVPAIVVAVDCRKAPEAPFPAAHEDAWAAWQWTVDHAPALGGVARRIAVAGEGAGANMAASIALRARDAAAVQDPVHQLLVCPVVDAELDSPSERQNAGAWPLDTASLGWFFDHYLPDPADRVDPRFALRRNADLRNLPSATVITADLDPLRSEGRAYAQALDDLGGWVHWLNVEGVTHEFFGLGAVVDAARAAVASAAQDLRTAFARVPEDA
jgi:acetyl esterase